ncbi:MAG: class I SAM-dependent methyltransferase [Pyrinomonadaceae bacterium]
MKRYALNTLVCPFTRSELSLVSFEETPTGLTEQDIERCDRLGIDPAEANSAVKEGVLYSVKSGKWFPIVNYTPIMLDFPTNLHHEFKERNSSKTEVLTKYDMADGKPREGELFVQRSFTVEWDLLNHDNVSFGYTPAQRDEFVKIEFDWPPGVLEQSPLKILEVGAGSGFETASLERVTGGSIFGFDLNLALVRKGHLLYSNPFINTAIASAFRLPLRPRSFQVVYSNGVLHHTYSTKEAFDSIEQFRAEDGVICIWVYAYEDYNTGRLSALLYVAEWTFRPSIARLPDFWQNLVVKLLTRHFHYKYRTYGSLGRETWTVKDSEHQVRDRWTPLYAHRHSFKEVIMWMQEKGLRSELIDAKAYQEKIGIPLIGIGIRGASQAYFDDLTQKQMTDGWSEELLEHGNL